MVLTFGNVKIETKIQGPRRVSVVAVEGGTRIAFEVDYNAHLPSGHPRRYAGLPQYPTPVRNLFKTAVRQALAS